MAELLSLHYPLLLPHYPSILFSLLLNLYKKGYFSDLTLPKKVPCQLRCLLLPAQGLSWLLGFSTLLSKPATLLHIFGKLFNGRDHRQEASFMLLSYSQRAIPRWPPQTTVCNKPVGNEQTNTSSYLQGTTGLSFSLNFPIYFLSNCSWVFTPSVLCTVSTGSCGIMNIWSCHSRLKQDCMV